MTAKQSTLKSPVKKRIESLDVIRGFVILGILIINLNYFSTITIERYNPLVHGDFSWLNKIIWIIGITLVKQRFMTIFAILFGAGIYLMAKHNQTKGIKEAGIHFSRMFWLLVIGMIHAYLIWDGDILVSYALCGLVVYFFRKLPAKTLMIIGIIMILGSFWQTISIIASNPQDSKEVNAFWSPNEKVLEKQLNAHNGTWMQETPARVGVAVRRQTSDFITYTLWRVGGLMLLGMALMKLEFLTGKLSKKVYIRTLLISAGIGLPLSFYGTFYYMSSNYSFRVFQTTYSLIFFFCSIVLGFTYIALLILMVKSQRFRRIKKSLSAVGKMALTNYIMQSIVGTLIFFGYGLGYFGKVDRTFLVLVLLAVWAFQILFSNLWLKYFNYGPLEWGWRSLTYRKMQALRIKNE